MKQLGIRLLGAAFGFLIGCLLLAVLYLLLQFIMELFDLSRVRFRAPIALFFVPLATSLFGYKMGPDLLLLSGFLFGKASIIDRLLLVAPFFWAGVVLAYILVFRPFGYQTESDEWIFVAKIILFPTIVLWCGGLGLQKNPRRTNVGCSLKLGN